MFRIETVEAQALRKGDAYLALFGGDTVCIYVVDAIRPGTEFPHEDGNAGKIAVLSNASFDGISASKRDMFRPDEKVRTVRLSPGAQLMWNAARGMMAEAGIV